MHNCTIEKQNRPISRRLVEGLHWIALIGLVALPCLGIIPGGYQGCVTHPPVWYAEPPRWRAGRSPGRRCSWQHFEWRVAWDYARCSYHRVGWQVWLLVTLLGFLSVEVPQQTPTGSGVLSAGHPPVLSVDPLTVEGLSKGWLAWCVLGLPIVRWVVAVSTVAWPYWGRSWLCRTLRWGLYRLFQLTVLGLVTAGLYHLGQVMGAQWSPWSSGCKRSGGVPPLALGGLVREAKGWRATIDLTEDGTYEITLTGPQGDQLFIRYRPVDEFDRRMLWRRSRDLLAPYLDARGHSGAPVSAPGVALVLYGQVQGWPRGLILTRS